MTWDERLPRRRHPVASQPQSVEVPCTDCTEPTTVRPQALQHPEFEPRCPGCRHEVEIREAAAARLRAEEERRKAEEERIEEVRRDLPAALRDCGTPARYSEYTKSAWEDRYGLWSEHDTFRELESWPASSPLEGRAMDSWLVLLYGLYGRRKTGLATAILGQALAAGWRDCRWEDMNTWLRQLRKNDFNRYDWIWWRTAQASLLVLDDVGSIKGGRPSDRQAFKPWWKEEVAELIRFRHAHALPTIVTTNGTLEDLGEVDPSLPSRMDVSLAWEMTGPDFRTAEILDQG